MSHTKDCVSQYFQNGNQIKFTSNFIRLTPHFGGYITDVIQRPFIPLYPVQESAFGPDHIIPCPVADVNAAAGMYTDLANNIYQASKDYTQDAVAPLVTFNANTIEFATYLWRKLGSDATKLNRFRFPCNIVDTFATDSAGIASLLELDQELARLYEEIKNRSDAELFLSPGQYTFGAASQFAIDWAAFLAAAAGAPIGLATIEIESIG